jgi:hypothetical protein
MSGPRSALAAAILTSLFTGVSSTNPSNETDRVRFRWAFVAISDHDDDTKLVQVTQDTTLQSGDRLKMYLELGTKCFVYVLHHGSQDVLRLLFPHDTEMFAGDYGVSRRYYVPRGAHWLELDENAGAERFHLLASAERLVELETHWKSYKSAVSSLQRQESSQKILDALRHLKKQYMKLMIDPERPIPIAGRIRGVDEDKERLQSQLANIAIDVSAPELYCRTFTIDHH